VSLKQILSLGLRQIAVIRAVKNNLLDFAQDKFGVHYQHRYVSCLAPKQLLIQLGQIILPGHIQHG
jgi:hypothetical protein